MSLITDTDLATFLGRPTIAGTGQAVMAAALASGMVTDYLGNPGITGVTSVTQILDGPAPGSNVILLPGGFPITAVTSVALWDDVALAWETPLVFEVDYQWNSAGLVSLTSVADPTQGFQFWPVTMQSIQVSYSYGFASVPASVQAVALSLAARYYSNPLGLAAQTIGGYSEAYAKLHVGPLVLDSSETEIISRYSDGMLA